MPHFIISKFAIAQSYCVSLHHSLTNVIETLDPPCLKIGWWWGDPHITTLDGLGYTFNGLGEYVLLDVNNSMAVIQGRTKQVIDKNTTQPQDATVFEGFALQETNSSRVSLKYAYQNYLTCCHVEDKSSFPFNHLQDCLSPALKCKV